MNLFNYIGAGLLITLATACQSNVSTEHQAGKPLLPGQQIKLRNSECGNLPPGQKTACHLQTDYDSGITSCGTSSSSPAFLCSGIVLRGTSSDLNRDYFSWNPSPASQTSGGVSFSYLRKDSKYSKLAYNYVTGFIFHPVLYTPTGLDSNISILCSFPLDGATSGRDDRGCGSVSGHPAGKPCYMQGVSTGRQWVDHYNANGGVSDYAERCAFIVENNVSAVDPEKEFIATLDAMKILASTNSEQNELRLATWAQNKQDIPVAAFFYLNGSSEGVASSQKDQKDFYEFSANHRVIPIIRITLPVTYSEDAVFEYVEDDQIYTDSGIGKTREPF